MTITNPKSAYFDGLKGGAPFLLVLAPFALLFGVVATEAGLDLAQIMGFSVIVIAGAAQFTALQLMSDNAPAIVILVSSLAVNLRMAMYSASLAPHFGAAPFWQRALLSYALFDQNYALSIARFEADRQMTLTDRLAFFAGASTPLVPVWIAFTLIGALVGRGIPEEFALDFALPITFIALIGPALRTVAHLTAALVSVVLSLLLAGLPYNLGLMVAALAALAAGAEMERRLYPGGIR
ncbi:AzlC family ABC transporter permease [Tropicimonas isoalkanivorans]|uniref:Predicted branched-chain amino acid permease (Azaleucine resistance) n=1 Tax=Tropicimonas isoalkanivorans TaxID=441112 RepID=A0A1I1N4X4_9RHOB|nr:AzlC family ABC transporter permease [Tropicimonas isoalkanivorans]SFC92711.1 Predicted branched-chain amino acid permease (azaleucine resistance) [Tropicimonas isoalkanivorans]